ncbi:MAG: hypothetical protein AAFU73_00795 [Planctomycetota bacterium]
MSWLEFHRTSGSIYLHAGPVPKTPPNRCPATVLGGPWPAHNDVASSSRGIWPNGIYKYAYYKAHAEAGVAPGCRTTAYGCEGIHIFHVAGRSGMGVHAGRSASVNGLGSRTMGCIRVPEAAMGAINRAHNGDPLSGIVVM